MRETGAHIPIKSALAFALLLKLSMFFYFVYQRDSQWNPTLVVEPWALKQLDTEWYFQPLDAMLDGSSYESVCKLPGFAPIYIPLRMVMSKAAAYNAICLLQMLLDAWCAVLLALLAMRIFNVRAMFFVVLVGYGISTFISVRSNYVLSDSFCTSFLIIALYMLQRGMDTSSNWYIAGAGVFAMWSFEMRPVMLVVFPVLVWLIACNCRPWRSAITKVALLMCPIAVATMAWWQHNRSTHDRSLWLIAPVEECMSHYGPEAASIRRFIIATGHDFQPWSQGSAAEWFLKRGLDLPAVSPLETSDFASTYNLDTLIQLRTDYKRIENEASLSSDFSTALIHRMDRCTESYKSEHAWSYYCTNRLHFLQMFLFPKRIDDLPLPARSAMNTGQKLVKMGSLLMLWVVHLGALIGLYLAVIRYGWNMLWWAGVGASSILVLSFIGFIEQRYLTASYPITLMFAAYAALRAWQAWSTKVRMGRIQG
jgi:hypothetical protein